MNYLRNSLIDLIFSQSGKVTSSTLQRDGAPVLISCEESVRQVSLA